MKIGLGIGLGYSKESGGGAVAPVNTIAPVISGTTTLGSTLTSTTGTWTGIPEPTFTYQWYRGATLISGATNSTYVTVLADSTANITCVVTATNVAGSANATSNVLTMGNYAPVNSVAPVISGTAVVGQVLTSTNGTWSNSPSSFSYQWKRGATNIGTNSSTYTLVQADAGQSITCVVTATNSAGSANATSNTLTVYSSVLDQYTSTAAAYSVRLLRGSHYNNALIRVRRSSDNVEEDVFVDSNFQLSLNSNITSRTSGTTLANFIGSSDGFVVTWYNQATASNNATQLNPANQPRVITGGALILINNKPSVSFDGTNDTLQNTAGTTVPTNITAFSVRSITAFPNTFRTIFNWKSYGFSFMSGQQSYRQVHIFRNGTTVRSQNYPLTTGQALDYMFNQANLERNEVNLTLQSGDPYIAGTSGIGSLITTAQYFLGNIQEIIIYESNETSNKSAIQTNINSFYAIY